MWGPPVNLASLTLEAAEPKHFGGDSRGGGFTPGVPSSGREAEGPISPAGAREELRVNAGTLDTEAGSGRLTNVHVSPLLCVRRASPESSERQVRTGKPPLVLAGGETVPLSHRRTRRGSLIEKWGPTPRVLGPERRDPPSSGRECPLGPDTFLTWKEILLRPDTPRTVDLDGPVGCWVETGGLQGAEDADVPLGREGAVRETREGPKPSFPAPEPGTPRRLQFWVMEGTRLRAKPPKAAWSTERGCQQGLKGNPLLE